MKKEDIEEIRDYVNSKLEVLTNGSYPHETKILQKILVLTTEVNFE